MRVMILQAPCWRGGFSHALAPALMHRHTDDTHEHMHTHTHAKQQQDEPNNWGREGEKQTTEHHELRDKYTRAQKKGNSKQGYLLQNGDCDVRFLAASNTKKEMHDFLTTSAETRCVILKDNASARSPSLSLSLSCTRVSFASKQSQNIQEKVFSRAARWFASLRTQ